MWSPTATSRWPSASLSSSISIVASPLPPTSTNATSGPIATIVPSRVWPFSKRFALIDASNIAAKSSVDSVTARSSDGYCSSNTLLARRPRARTRRNSKSDTQAGANPMSLAVVDHAPGFPVDALGDIQGPFRALGGAVRTRRGLCRTHDQILSFEAVGKHLELAGGLPVGKRLEQHVVSGHRLGRAIPRSVRGHERAAAIVGGKHAA